MRQQYICHSTPMCAFWILDFGFTLRINPKSKI
jgi:hypothetical protein